MIKIVKDKDIFDPEFNCLVNPVNCVGVMGAGLAKQFKILYPENFAFYKRSCDLGGMYPGAASLFFDVKSQKLIVNLATKDHWKDKSMLEFISAGVKEMMDALAMGEDLKMKVAIPKLGCGLGGLSWEKVKPLIIKTISFNLTKKHENKEFFILE